MLKAIREYCKEIEIPDIITERVIYFYNFYTKNILKNLIKEEKINAFFITDYFDENKKRIYENLWFFTNSYAGEVKSFQIKDDLDLGSYSKKITRIEIIKENFEPFMKNVSINYNSKLSFLADTQMGYLFELKAASNNCNKLYEIVQKLFLPNLI